MDIVDIQLLYRQKWALCRAQRLTEAHSPHDAELLEGLINYMDSETDRHDPEDTIRLSMVETRTA